MSEYYLTIFKDDTWRKQIGHFDFEERAAFQSWNRRQNDELSSFKFKLPVGWELRIHEHRDTNSRYKPWRGTGAEVKVNKRDLPGFIHDEASGHSWVRIGHDSVQSAFNALSEMGATAFRLVRPESVRMPAGHNGDWDYHQQGIQKTSRGEFIVSGSAPETGYIYLTDSQNRAVKVATPTSGNFNHLGGFQVAEYILAVGYERLEGGSNGTSKILFFDVSNVRQPLALNHLSITRNTSGDTAGAVGLVKMQDYWLLVVANWNAAKLDFYKSNGSNLNDLGASFGQAPIASWRASVDGLGQGSIDNNWEKYQNINLFSQIGARPSLSDLWFVALHTNIPAAQADWADLYHLNMREEQAGNYQVAVKKRAKKHFRRTGSGPRFRNGAGFYFDKQVNAFEVYSCEAQLSDGGTVNRCNKWI